MDLETLEKIQVKRFRFKNRPEKEVIGFIAQELEKVLPGAVEKGDTWKIDYLQIIPLMINSIKELNARVKKLESKK